MKSATFEIFAGWCAVLTGIFTLLYSIAFILVQQSAPFIGALLSSLFLLAIGLLSSAALTAIYARLRGWAQEFSLWAYLLGFVASLGSAMHGGYDLANEIHPSDAATALTSANVPSEVDPRGLLTFLVAGLAILSFSWLIVRSRRLPRGLGYLGYASAALSIILYLARLIVLSPSNLVIVVPAILSGFLVAPIWYVWLGLALWRGSSRWSD